MVAGVAATDDDVVAGSEIVIGVDAGKGVGVVAGVTEAVDAGIVEGVCACELEGAGVVAIP